MVDESTQNLNRFLTGFRSGSVQDGDETARWNQMVGSLNQVLEEVERLDDRVSLLAYETTKTSHNTEKHQQHLHILTEQTLNPSRTVDTRLGDLEETPKPALLKKTFPVQPVPVQSSPTISIPNLASAPSTSAPVLSQMSNKFFLKSLGRITGVRGPENHRREGANPSKTPATCSSHCQQQYWLFLFVVRGYVELSPARSHTPLPQ